MRFLPFSLSGLLLAAALPARAQTITDAPAAPRFYVGLGLYNSFYQPITKEPTRLGGAWQLPVQLVAGYQLRPRLAVQLGVAYSSYSTHYAFAGRVYSNSPDGYISYDRTTTVRDVTVSALARYTLTRNPAHRLQFDALGGLALERGSSFSRGTQADSVGGTRNVASFSNRASGTALLLTAGLGTRYRLGSRFELLYDFTLNRTLNGDAPHPAPLGLTGSQTLGLRYRFGH